MAIIKGTNKADLLNGTAEDDTIVGLGGKDVITADTGDDILMGGPGNDTYRVTGRAGDHLHVVDPGIALIGGVDTLDFTGGSTAAAINLAPGSVSTVDGREIELSSEIEVGKLDIAVLQDLSGSFYDDCETMDTIAPKLAAALTAASVDTMFGVASFIDKPFGSFGWGSDYVYRTDLTMTADSAAFVGTVTNLTTGSGSDYQESQIEALMHLAKTDADFGFRTDSYRVVVLATDADYHRAGDSPTQVPNNGDAVLDDEDYPSVAQLSASLEDSGIIPIFAVTSDVMTIYQDLVEQLGVGAVVELTTDSSNLVKAVKGGLGDLFSSNIENAIGTSFGDTIKGNAFDNKLDGAAGNDTIAGLSGNDTLIGGLGTDKLDGGRNDDTLSGGDGKDRLVGNHGGDRLDGGAGNDNLLGGAGKDTLNGGIGNDRLTGGAAGDVFDFGNAAGTATDWGHDIVADFVHGVDKLDLSGMAGIADFADLDVGTNAAGFATVSFNASVIVLTNVTHVVAGDFIFA